MAGEGKRRSVLVVDEDETYAEWVSTNLERSADGVETVVETDPAAALHRASERRFDCVVCEYPLAGTDALELVASLRELHDGLPVVLVADRGSEEVAQQALRRGVADYLRKGTDDDPATLAACLDRVADGADGDGMATVARMATHDLRNPLSVARGFLEMHRETGDPDHYDRVVGALDRMEAILEDVETLARAKEPVSRERVDLSSLATAAWEIAGAPAAELHAEYGPQVGADPSMLRAVLENLFDNAVTHAGPDVTVKVGELPDGEGFFVADDGPGIPEADRELVFERGYSGGDGTGMGLDIVRTIVDAHDWDVEIAESRSGGTRFEFRGVSVGG
ncbi:MAG: hybrid sensor histidine kinase/response regulator [Halobacteriales archaeon]